jgi:predicted nuclease of predicted toxin-antitoxin system
MKLLLDQNISFRIIKKVRGHFLDVQSVKENNLENTDDFKIWEYARQNGFTIITFDEDFFNIQLLKGFPPKIIWFKTGNLDKNQFTEFLIAQKEIICSFIEDDIYKDEGCLELFLIKKQ